jgi:hypothetical protein
MKRFHLGLLTIAGLWLASTCGAADNSFRMTAMFSDKAGLIQYIQLQESSGLDGQEHFKGLTLVVTSRAGIVKSITLPNDLPGSSTANSFALIGTRQYPGDLVDFDLPQGFLPTDGGTLVFAGVDVWDYQELPANGYTVLTRADGPTTNPAGSPSDLLVRSFTGRVVGLLAIMDPVIEYYNKALDHYFISASQPDIDALDSGRIPGWKRTGELFTAWTTPLVSVPPFGAQSPPGMGPVCRLYIPPGEGDSHFFSASPTECEATRAAHPAYLTEADSAFYASLPNPVTGTCGYDQQAVYRLWNQRIDSNHRYTVSPALRDFMLTQGYVAEGSGPDRVAMCVGGGISE